MSQTVLSPLSFEYRHAVGGLDSGRGAYGGEALRFGTQTRNLVPAPKFAHSLTRCTEISEESVMDVARGEMVEAELTPVGAKRTTWRGAEYHQEQTERHRAVERHQDRCYHEPQLRGG